MTARSAHEVPLCPTYRPTAEEFLEPGRYVESILPEVARYGMCKVVPPPGVQDGGASHFLQSPCCGVLRRYPYEWVSAWWAAAWRSSTVATPGIAPFVPPGAERGGGGLAL